LQDIPVPCISHPFFIFPMFLCLVGKLASYMFRKV
jgi:hypothetical protein